MEEEKSHRLFSGFEAIPTGPAPLTVVLATEGHSSVFMGSLIDSSYKKEGELKLTDPDLSYPLYCGEVFSASSEK